MYDLNVLIFSDFIHVHNIFKIIIIVMTNTLYAHIKIELFPMMHKRLSDNLLIQSYFTS